MYKAFFFFFFFKSYQQNFNLENQLHEIKEELYLKRAHFKKKHTTAVNDSTKPLDRGTTIRKKQINTAPSSLDSASCNHLVHTTENLPFSKWSTLYILLYSSDKMG